MTAAVDAHGNPITGDAGAIDLYDTALDRLVRFHPAVLDAAGALNPHGEAIAPMGAALMAYLNLMSTDGDDVGAARTAWQQLSASAANDRERAHAAAIGAWIDGNWLAASRLLDDLLTRWPADLLALMIGHQLDFFLGDAANLRDRPLRSLPQYDRDHPHAAFVRGMAAFGLEEAGHYGQALDTGLAAVETNHDDVWGIHAVVHTYEMQGRVAEGIHFLASDGTRWESGNLFTVHNWWHLALYHLEAGNTSRCLSIYDDQIHTAASAGVPIEMLDASALLWRLLLDGVDTGDRFSRLADAWSPKAAAAPWYAFNDLHAAMAFAASGRHDEAAALIRSRQAWLEQVDGTREGTNARMTAEIGLPTCRAVAAFGLGNYEEAVDALLPIRRSFQHFGGSHAQRDALQRTLLEAAIRSRRYELARALAAERLGLRESSAYGWDQWARVLAGTGNPAGAASAQQHADGLRSQLSTA